ncbi:hypothetical protein BK660_16285 [Pseudomonas brassicacearum]|uniref:Uncharacterized protein n=1 Tax=Pseudomonas brassicacearum TaxID=930166 RepID=A0A423I546_9PSED|nr:hypothetical protein BK660_16285 [Pseudomonas brassicacearum]
MVSLKLTALIISGLLSVGSLGALAQSNGNDAPVDKGGMPPSTEMNANSADGDALPPGSINGGNGGDANGSSTSPGKGSGAVSGGSSMGNGGGDGSGKSGSAGDAEDEKGG